MRTPSIVIVAALAVAMGSGCHRRSAPEFSRTQVTSVEVVPATPENDFGLFQERAAADLANLDQRISKLSARADAPGAPAEAKSKLAEVRRRRDTLYDDLSNMGSDNWTARRTVMDENWDSVSDLMDQVGDLLATPPTNP